MRELSCLIVVYISREVEASQFDIETCWCGGLWHLSWSEGRVSPRITTKGFLFRVFCLEIGRAQMKTQDPTKSKEKSLLLFYLFAQAPVCVGIKMSRGRWWYRVLSLTCLNFILKDACEEGMLHPWYNLWEKSQQWTHDQNQEDSRRIHSPVPSKNSNQKSKP